MDDLSLAELMAALSQVTDLGMGQPPGTAARSCLVAAGLARRMEIDEQEVSAIYYTTLLQHIGCTAYAHETAALVGGDDIAFRAAGARVDDANLRETLMFLFTGIARGVSPPHKARAVFNVMRAGPAEPQRLYRSNCEVAVRTADRLGLSASVQHGLDTIYARWDGKGVPAVRGEDIALPARFAQVAGQAILFHDLGGPDLVIETIRRRAGTALDPTIADAFVHHGLALLAEIDAADPFIAVIDSEPDPQQRIAEPRIDGVARAFADVTDLKSPWLHGHSTGVATRADAAARELRLPPNEVTAIRRAGYLHDLGRVGVPSGIWDKAGSLTTTEWEQVRLHAYHSERILMRSPSLAELAPLAAMHHERLDGSGYHVGASGAAIPTGARILAAADAWDAMTHDRPHRSANPSDKAAETLQGSVGHGVLDAEAVHAVLQATGLAVKPGRREWPAGLTDREVEVLRLAARGLSNKDIGNKLSISPKTADHHIQHIYAKIDVSTRAGAAIFAMEHDLVHEQLSAK